MTRITISQGQLTIGTNGYGTGAYAAISEGTRIAIVHKNNTKDRIFDSAINEVKLNNVAYASAALFCVAFNSLCAGALDSEVADILEEISELKANTDYPSIILSTHMVVSNVNKQSIAHDALPGYAEVSAPDTNAGDIYLGGADVDANSCHIAPGKSKAIEHSNLAAWYVLAAQNADVVDIHGSQKP